RDLSEAEQASKTILTSEIAAISSTVSRAAVSLQDRQVQTKTHAPLLSRREETSHPVLSPDHNSLGPSGSDENAASGGVAHPCARWNAANIDKGMRRIRADHQSRRDAPPRDGMSTSRQRPQ